VKEESNWGFAFGLFVTFLVLFFVREHIDALTAVFIDLRSEYRLVEQLTKLGLLLSAMFCFFVLKADKQEEKFIPASLLLALSITLYLSESNMIESKLQPLFGAILILPTLYFLLKGRLFKELVLFCIGLAIIAAGVLSDTLQEVDAVKAIVPESIASLVLSVNEEHLDTAGVTFIACCACVLAGNVLLSIWREKPLTLLMLFVGAALVAWGNGLAHYQYKPSTMTLVVAFCLSAIGIAGLMLSRRLPVLAQAGRQLYTPREYRLDAFVVFFFLLMPVFLHDYNYSISSVLWCWVVYVCYRTYRRALV